ncbi:MAG: NAD(P)H-dependent oxidoreductase subunit E [Ideonella sp.]|nr:NAD(P)H-dependent oxidoreductase subunit E [Ideonella sp.]
MPETSPASVVSVADLRGRLRQKSQLKGRQPEHDALEQVRALIGPGPHPRDRLIELLHRLNDHHRGLFERHLVALAAEMNLALTEVYEVATFYHHFDIVRGEEQPARLTVRVCDGLSCELAGARELLQRLPALLGAEVRVVAAPCVGRCEQAPVAVVGQAPVVRADAAAVRAAALRSPLHPAPRDDGAFDPAADAPVAVTASPAEIAPAYVGYDAYRARGGYRLAAAVADGRQPADDVLQAMTDAGLRGLGGAGFPAGRKWSIVRQQSAPRLLAVNIDEGEPGTFKDRTYLERDPHRFIEGMLVAATVVGIEACYVYLRDEYHGCRAILERELQHLQADPPCALPRIELRRGAGAYICGEESAMLESIEGKRGEPRMRPPYIAQVGLFGRPTLEHNFETLYWVRDIVERGPAWFAGFGRHGRKGLRSFSVSGRVREPGVKLAPAGITLQELVDEYCGGMLPGHDLYAYLPGGASGGILPESMADLPLDFGTLEPHGCFVGSHAVVILSDQDDMKAVALNLMRFFEDESCGQCTPCRVGTEKAVKLMEEGPWDETLLTQLSAAMRDASICGLGQAAPNPLMCVFKYFRDDLTKPMGRW